MKVKQCELYSAKLDGTEWKMVTWIPSEHAKKGTQMTFKKSPSLVWIISRVFMGEREQSELHTDWKVGGLC